MCALIATAWALTIWYDLYLLSGGVTFCLSNGTIAWNEFPRQQQAATGWEFASYPTQDGLRWWRWNWRAATTEGWMTAFPLWCPLLVCAMPVIAAWRLDILARRRERVGACPTCHYSLAGLAPNSPCPECGKKAGGAGAAKS